MKTIIEKATEAVLNTPERNMRRIPCKLSNNPDAEGTVRWEGFLFFPPHPDFDSITVYTHTDSKGVRHIVHSVPLPKLYRGGCPSEKKGWVIVSPNTPTSQIYPNATVATWRVKLNQFKVDALADKPEPRDADFGHDGSRATDPRFPKY